MPDIFGILNIGKGALIAQQRAIDVNAHNIANANTEGYCRQRVNFSTQPPINFSPGQMGTGVKAAEIERIYDRFISLQLSQVNQALGQGEAEKSGLQEVEMIFDESSGYGLSRALSDFWNAWQDLANEPAGEGERIVLIAKTKVLTNTFNRIASQLTGLQKDMDVNIKGTVEEINLIARQVADLNQQISAAEVGNQNANDFRDQRDLLLKQLSFLIGARYFETDTGKVTVLVGGGRPLVEDGLTWELSTETNGAGHQDVVWVDRDGNKVNLNAEIEGGKVKGWLEVRDSYVSRYLNQLDTLANGLITEVNNLHQVGFGLNGSTGNIFFEGSSAFDIQLSSQIEADPNLIAASETLDGIPGDNRNALAIAELQNQLIFSGGRATFDDYYNSLIGKTGTESKEAQTNYEHSSAMIAQLERYRDSVSGVSLDEEMVNLVKFQHAYDAAAKLISTIDELLDTVISMV